MESRLWPSYTETLILQNNMMEHGNKMILIRKGTHSVWHQPSHQSTSPLSSTLSRNDFHWIKHVSLALNAEWEIMLYCTVYSSVVGYTAFMLKLGLKIIRCEKFCVWCILLLNEMLSIKLHLFVHGHIVNFFFPHLPKHENLYFELGAAATQASIWHCHCW